MSDNEHDNSTGRGEDFKDTIARVVLASFTISIIWASFGVFARLSNTSMIYLVLWWLMVMTLYNQMKQT